MRLRNIAVPPFLGSRCPRGYRGTRVCAHLDPDDLERARAEALKREGIAVGNKERTRYRPDGERRGQWAPEERHMIGIIGEMVFGHAYRYTPQAFRTDRTTDFGVDFNTPAGRVDVKTTAMRRGLAQTFPAPLLLVRTEELKHKADLFVLAWWLRHADVCWLMGYATRAEVRVAEIWKDQHPDGRPYPDRYLLEARQLHAMDGPRWWPDHLESGVPTRAERV